MRLILEILQYVSGIFIPKHVKRSIWLRRTYGVLWCLNLTRVKLWWNIWAFSYWTESEFNSFPPRGIAVYIRCAFLLFTNVFHTLNVFLVFLRHKSLTLSYDSICHLFHMHDNVIKWKHFPRYWPFVRGIQRSSINSPHTGQWRGALVFCLICALNKRLGKQSRGWWFETPWRPLWRHCNGSFISYAPIYFISKC